MTKSMRMLALHIAGLWVAGGCLLLLAYLISLRDHPIALTIGIGATVVWAAIYTVVLLSEHDSQPGQESAQEATNG